MRSWRSLVIGLGLGLGLGLGPGGCGTDPDLGTGGVDKPPVDPDVCETSYLTYDNFGEPFIANWCRGCHSSDLPANMRQHAPADANFDTLADVKAWSPKILAKAGSTPASMPPAGGPSDAERAMLREWLGCGAR